MTQIICEVPVVIIRKKVNAETFGILATIAKRINAVGVPYLQGGKKTAGHAP